MGEITQTSSFFKKLWHSITGKKKDQNQKINVYFISGMCYNCTVFDKLSLPHGFKKTYIEWHIPREDESLNEYAKVMAETIDQTRPFILVGYSFGAVIIQEMNTFLSPIKSIIISSFKSVDEIPTLFRAAKRAKLVKRVPDRIYSSTEFITHAFNRFVYNIPTDELSDVMVYTDPIYIKWAIKKITEWIPNGKIKHLYHIHGSADQIFPCVNIKNAFIIENGDHLMVMKKADMVSSILDGILLMKERA